MANKRNEGYYISASLLRMVPYDFKGIWRFMRSILPNASFIRADLMSLRVGRTTMTVHSAMMTNNLVLRGDVPFSLDLLEDEIVSSIRFKLGGVNMVLSVCFMDDSSYEVSLSAPHRDIISISPDDYPFWERVVFTFIGCIDPIYGTLGVEANTCGVLEIMTEEFFASTDQLYIHSHIVQHFGELLKQLLAGYKLKNLNHGYYWGNGIISEGERLPRHIQKQLGKLLAEYLAHTYPEKTQGSIVSSVYSSL